MANETKMISRDFAKKHFEILANRYRGSFTGEAFERAVQEIAEMPGVDAVEVVRCKDCKHWGKLSLTCKILPSITSEHENWYADDFCSYGERKDNGV